MRTVKLLLALRRDSDFLKVQFRYEIIIILYFVFVLPQFLLIFIFLFNISKLPLEINKKLECFPQLRNNYQLRFLTYCLASIIYQLLISINMIYPASDELSYLNFESSVHIGYFATALLLTLLIDRRYHNSYSFVDVIVHAILLILAFFSLKLLNWYGFMILITISCIWIKNYKKKGDYL